jgi:beta-hydroxylase
MPATDATCAIRVGSDTKSWQEGRSLVFDDCHEHEAWNDTDQVRVVLFVDFLRPLAFPLSKINEAIVSWIGKARVVKDGMQRLEKWNEQVDAAALKREQRVS